MRSATTPPRGGRKSIGRAKARPRTPRARGLEVTGRPGSSAPSPASRCRCWRPGGPPRGGRSHGGAGPRSAPRPPGRRAWRPSRSLRWEAPFRPPRPPRAPAAVARASDRAASAMSPAGSLPGWHSTSLAGACSFGPGCARQLRIESLITVVSFGGRPPHGSPAPVRGCVHRAPHGSLAHDGGGAPRATCAWRGARAPGRPPEKSGGDTGGAAPREEKDDSFRGRRAGGARPGERTAGGRRAGIPAPRVYLASRSRRPPLQLTPCSGRRRGSAPARGTLRPGSSSPPTASIRWGPTSITRMGWSPGWPSTAGWPWPTPRGRTLPGVQGRERGFPGGGGLRSGGDPAGDARGSGATSCAGAALVLRAGGAPGGGLPHSARR